MKRLDYYWTSFNLVSFLLLPFAGLFCVVSFIRRKFYRYGFFKVYKAATPVVVIGNITVGGTGKTPLIIELVKQLQAIGKKPGVISRGYGGASITWPQIVNEQTTAAQVGDEPKLIHLRTACPVVVGPDRQDDIELLLNNYNCDVILSDDGLQHYALYRDIEIVVVDAQRNFGNGLCLPAGPLREPVLRLQQVDLVLLNGGRSNQQSFTMQAKFCLPVNSNKNEKLLLSDFFGKTVHGVAGIGNPQRFFEMLKNLGITVIEHEFSDHHAYVQSELLFNDDLAVLMTEKDAVKCSAFKLSNHWSVPVDLVFSESAKIQLKQLLSTI